jgi:aldose 1-epimerase
MPVTATPPYRFALVAIILAALHTAAAQLYAARHVGDVVELLDARARTMVSIIPSVGNVAFAMRVNGHDVLHWPHPSIDAFKLRPTLSGIPLLAPWANRLDEEAFYANGKRYAFDMTLGNVRGPIPIHGFLATTDRWQLIETKADGTSAWATSRLEFFREPAWMKQWPFAHTIEVTHRLENGVLEVQTRITNISAEPMPLAVGFHPYLQLTDAARDDWTIAVGARARWLLADSKLPTGQSEPVDRLFPNPQAAALKDHSLDDVFADLIRDTAGRATMTVTGRSQSVDVVLGPKFRAVVIYAPRGRNFICFEPMVAVTNALNLAHAGLYRELQSVAPGETWQESFWIRPKGF